MKSDIREPFFYDLPPTASFGLLMEGYGRMGFRAEFQSQASLYAVGESMWQCQTHSTSFISRLERANPKP